MNKKTDVKVIVSGGRFTTLHADDYKQLNLTLAPIFKWANCTIINIGAPGVETEVNNYFERNKIIPIQVIPPNGLIANAYIEAQRATCEKASVAIFFSGGEGTAKYKEMAEQYNLQVHDFSRPIVKIQKTSVDFLRQCIDVQKERGTEYEGGGKERSFEKMATIFNAYTGKDLTPAHVALMLQILKDVRQFSSDRYHGDSCLDSISYASLKAELLHQQYNN